jgi:hypothetical protein
MNTLVIRLTVFACIFGGAIVGMLLGPLLPKHHLSGDSKDVIKMGMGLVGTMTAILLGLLVASAKNFYDAQATEPKSLPISFCLTASWRITGPRRKNLEIF